MFRTDRHVFFSASAVLLLAVAVCFRFFGEVILHPGDFLFGEAGDGLKNYYTVAYQAIHGNGEWFGGMLYPFGEHIIYADGQPILVRLLSLLVNPEVNNGSQIIAAMNLLMIFSLVLTTWCVHRLLIWNFVNPWFAVPFSITIAFLSPQLARFIGHYALGYTFFVPMCWLMIASFPRYGRPWLVSIVTSLVVLAFGFLHPYYLVIFVILLGSILAWEMILEKFSLQQVADWAPKLFALFVPLVLFMLYQKGVDPYTDRPISPSGTFSYMATFQSVFVPVAEPFRSLFNSYFFRIFTPSSWEGNAYVGMVATFSMFASGLALFRRFKTRKWKTLTHPILPNTLKQAFVPGIITLLFAMGLFHNLGLYWLSEYIAPLKQFRSLGRVAWIFYYVFSIWTVYHLYVLWRYFRSVKSGKFSFHASVIIGLCAFLWMLDAIVNIKNTKADIVNPSDSGAFSDQYSEAWINAGINISEYQAIIPLPLMLVGSEKIGLEDGHLSLQHAMRGSFSTGLPIVGGTMSRTSLLSTEKTAQLVANPLLPRKIFEDFDLNRKLLLLRSAEPLKPTELWLLESAELLFDHPDYNLYSTSVSALRILCEKERSKADSLPINSIKPYFIPREFEKNAEELWGVATYKLNRLDDVFDTIFAHKDTLILSYWLKVDPKTEVLPTRVLSIDNEWVLSGGVGKNPNLLDGWLLISDTIFVEPGKHYKYVIETRTGILSRIMLRKSGQTIVHQEQDLKFVNNIPLK